MTLDQFLTEAKMTASDFGDRCHPPISEASISRIRRGEQNISFELANRIVAASGGKITADALLAQFAERGTPAQDAA